MYEEERPVAITRTKLRKSTIILAVCLFVAVAVAIAAVSGLLGYRAGKGNATVIYSRSGETASSLSAVGSRTVEQVVDEIADTVVEIRCTVKVQVGGGWFQRPTTYSATSAGSGVIISSNGTIVTNHHVIEGATDITVTTRSGKEYSAEIIGSDQSADIAVIRISGEDFPYAVFGSSSSLKVGQTVVVIGNPLGTLGGTVTGGIISALDRDITVEGVTMKLLQTDAAINSGNSGGGLFDLDGRLVGVINAKSSGTSVEGLGFAIPADDALATVTALLG